MKWFRHETRARRNPDLLALVEEWGWAWYGRWWALVEIVAEDVRSGNTAFSFQKNDGSPASMRQLSRDLGTTARRLTNFCRFLSNNGLIDTEAWNSKNLIFIPKLRELSDRYTLKLLNGVNTLSPQNSPIEVQENRSTKESTCGPREIVFPEELTRLSKWTETWVAWESHRREIGKPLKPTGIQRQLKFLVKQPDPVAVIEQAIRNGWQGLFALKNGQKSGHSRPVRDAIAVNRELMKAQELIQEMEKSGQKES